MNVLLLVVGTFMDLTPAILIFTPIFLPIAQNLGMDTIQFGMSLVFNFMYRNNNSTSWKYVIRWM